jgi:hypothetical protein
LTKAKTPQPQAPLLDVSDGTVPNDVKPAPVPLVPAVAAVEEPAPPAPPLAMVTVSVLLSDE